MSQTPANTTLRPDHEDGPVFQDVARFRGIIFDKLMKPHGITMSQGWVILHLMQENGLRQADLAARMDVATVTTSKLIDRLEARGFVERRADPVDRRTNRIFATRKAKALLKIMRQARRDLDGMASAGVNPEELAITYKVLGQMRQNLKARIAGD